MIDVNFDNCTGCGACKNVCPVNAIKMIPNNEGFLYPVVDENACINCTKCNKVCPIQKENIPTDDRKFYAVYSKNEIERSKSSTGGMCAIIAKHIIEQGGWFCGASFYKGKLAHRLTKSFDFFDKYMRGSKYFQSDTENIYNEVADKLKEGDVVAFVGTPCQVNALRKFLSKPYDNLYLIDLICHGVPSPKVFEKFIESKHLEKDIKNDVSVNFRNKKLGWHTFTFVISDDKNILYSEVMHNDTFYKAFLSDICLRKSCHSCPYASTNRVSDIMVGDFWGCPENIDDNKGINLISINNKGTILLDNIKKHNPLFLKEYPKDKVLQPQLRNPSPKHFARDKFFEYLDKFSFDDTISQIFDKNKKVALLNFHFENNNYGAILTSYALNKYINSLGFDAYNIDYTPAWGKNSYSSSNFPEFRAKNLPLTYKCNSMKDLIKLNDDFGTFIVGSDQVFNYEFVSKYKHIYFLGFVDDTNKSIAYSASFGQAKFSASNDEIDNVGMLLSKFNRIGVREKSGVDICRDVFRTKATHVLDPVFLLTKDEWNKIADTSVKNTKNVYYIVNEELNKEAENSLSNFQSIRHNLTIEEWLATLNNASFVLTDSFHCICFCLIFNKQFIYIGKDNGRQERVKSLFEMFNIPQSSFVISQKIDNSIIRNADKIDYTDFAERLKKWLDISQNFLTEALSCENEKMYNPYYFILKKISSSSSSIRKLKLKYYKYYILSKICFGKKRKKYKQKRNDIKLEIKMLKR